MDIIIPIEINDPEIGELIKDVCNKRYDRFNSKEIIIVPSTVKLVPYKIYVANRNDQCPCKSGLKYKHCHGSILWNEIFN